MNTGPTRPTIIQCLKDPDVFGPLGMMAPSWYAWRTILSAAYGLRLNPKEQRLFTKLTKREYSPPPGGWRMIVVIAARQSGKSQVAGVVVDYESLFPLVDAPNLRSVLVAQSEDDVKQTLFRYAKYPFDKSETLAANIADTGSTTTTIALKTGVVVHAVPCKPESVRGPSAVVAALDEPAHYRSNDGNPLDAKIIEAVDPSLFTTKGKLWLLSSPYAEYGRLYELHRDYFGKDDKRILVIQSDSLTLNPTLDADDLEEFRRVNPDAATSEVDGMFRANLSKLFDPATLQLCVDTGRTVKPPTSAKYVAFVDSASGGKVNMDNFACAIAHVENQKTVLDVVRWWTPPFSTKVVIAQIAELVTPYRIKKVIGDRHGKGYIEDAFKDRGLTYEEVDAAHSASENFLQTEKMVNAMDVSLLDVDEMLREFRILDRVRGSGGMDRVDHPRGTHDDAAAAVSGAIVYARERAVKGGSVVNVNEIMGATRLLNAPIAAAGLGRIPDVAFMHPHERPSDVRPEADVRMGKAKAERWRRAWGGG